MMHPRRTSQRSRGYTLLEVTVVLGIVTTIVITLATIQKDIISLDSVIHGAFGAQGDARRAFRTMTKELRATTYAENGAYPIGGATATSVIFYADTDSDGETERIRYFLSGTDLQRGIIEPVGTPATYTGTETITTFVEDIDNGAMAVFDYYDETYSGSGSPLSSPFDLSTVRLVKVTVTIDKNGDRSPGPQTYVMQVALRNLKDNL